MHSTVQEDLIPKAGSYDVIETKRTGFIRGSYEVVVNGWYAGKLSASILPDRGIFEQGEKTCRFYRERFFGGLFLLACGSEIVARADKPSAIRDQFVIEYAGHTYLLKKRSIFGRKVVVLEGNEEVGVIEPKSVFSFSSVSRLPAYWKAPVQCFVVWLALIIWRRQANGGL